MNTTNIKSFENMRWASFRQPVEFRHTAALEFIEKGPVLDIGCGDGLLMSLLRDKGVESFGVDISDDAVNACVTSGLHVDLIESANTLPFPDASFEDVVMLDVLEHVYDPAPLIEEAHRVSKKYIIVGVPNFSSLPARLQMLFGKVPENNHPKKGHIYWFNWSILRDMLKGKGFHITHRICNAPWEKMPLVGMCMKMLAHIMPNLFALSFVVLCEKV